MSCLYNEYETDPKYLRKINVETRDNLGVLAANIVASNNDLSNDDPHDLVKKLYDTIYELHMAYMDLDLPEMP